MKPAKNHNYPSIMRFEQFVTMFIFDKMNVNQLFKPIIGIFFILPQNVDIC